MAVPSFPHLSSSVASTVSSSGHVSSLLVALAVATLACADFAVGFSAPQGPHAEASSGSQADVADLSADVLWDVSRISLSFVFVALLAKQLGIGGTVILRSKQGKAERAARAPKTTDSPTPPTAARRKQSNSRFDAGPAAVKAKANTLVVAVNAGKAAQLPLLLDGAMASLSRAPAGSNVAEAQAAQLLISSLRACAAKRCFREALAAYDHVEHLIGGGCATTWSILLWSAMECGRLDRGSFFAKRLRATGEISQNDVVNLVRCAMHHRDLKQLVEILGDCKAADIKIEVLTRNRALAVLASGHAMDFAGEFVSRTPDVPLDIVAYNTLMKGYALADKPKLCLELYAQMRSANLTASDVTFGILLDTCVGGSMFEAARQIFHDLMASDMAVNVVHYTTFIKGLVSAGSLSDARDVLVEMHKNPHTMPDVITYSTLAKAYAEAGCVDDGISLLRMMRRHGVEPDAISFNIVLGACVVSADGGSKIREAFEQVVSLGFRPTSPTYSVLVKACAKNGCWDLALELIGSAPSRFHVWPETRIYAQLAQACASAGAGAEVLQTYAMLLQARRACGEAVDAPTNMRFVRYCASCGLGADSISSIT